MKCPNPACRAENEEFYQYCMSCGFPLREQKPAPKPPPPAPIPEPEPLDSLTGGDDWGAIQPMPAPSGGGEIIEGGHSQQAGQPSSLMRSGSERRAVIPAPTPRPRPEREYGAGGISPLNPWGPFAGYGTRRRHTGWLMDSQGQRVDELIGKVDQKFQLRQIPKTATLRRTLTGRGVLVENRPYFILKRGLASVALYIASFGQDLFISLASYLKPPVSPLRVLILLAMAAFQLFMVYLYPILLNEAVNNLFMMVNPLAPGVGGDVGGLFTLACLVGPLGFVNTIALILFALYSLYKFITEKDLLAGLRVLPNEFNEDDLMAMEKAVEQTVRIALTELKLNPDDLRATSAGRGGQLF